MNFDRNRLKLIWRFGEYVKVNGCFDFSITKSPEAEDIFRKNEVFQKKILAYRLKLFDQWAIMIPDQIENNMKKNLFEKDPKNREIRLNFSSEVKVKFYSNLISKIEL